SSRKRGAFRRGIPGPSRVGARCMSPHYLNRFNASRGGSPMKPRSHQTKSHSTLSRRGFLQATALTGAAAAVGARSAHAAGGKIVVGTWGGDYQNLIQKNISAPLLQPQGIEVIYDTDNDSPRKTKMMAQKMLPRGTMDISALNRAGSYEMYKAGTLLDIDTS